MRKDTERSAQAESVHPRHLHGAEGGQEADDHGTVGEDHGDIHLLFSPITGTKRANKATPTIERVKKVHTRDRKSTRLNSSHCTLSRMPSSA